MNLLPITPGLWRIPISQHPQYANRLRASKLQPARALRIHHLFSVRAHASAANDDISAGVARDRDVERRAGMHKRNFVGTADRSATSPPCARAIWRTRLSPTPVPLGLGRMKSPVDHLHFSDFTPEDGRGHDLMSVDRALLRQAAGSAQLHPAVGGVSSAPATIHCPPRAGNGFRTSF